MKRDDVGESAGMDEAAIREAKRRAGRRAAEDVESGTVVGLGTGSTAAHAIEALGERVREEGLALRGVPSSHQARQLAIDSGIDVVELDEVDGIDVAIDGADQVADGDLIKGGGAAHAREKVIDVAADEFVVVFDPRKESERLDLPVPVEVLPVARPTVQAAVRDLGGDPTLRAAERKDGPVVTDNGNQVLDVAFGPLEDPRESARALSTIPGVLEHGLFVDVADRGYLGTADGVEVREW